MALADEFLLLHLLALLLSLFVDCSGCSSLVLRLTPASFPKAPGGDPLSGVFGKRIVFLLIWTEKLTLMLGIISVTRTDLDHSFYDVTGD